MQKCNFGFYEHQNYKFLFFREHKQSIRAKLRIRAQDVDFIYTKEFISWFEERVSTFSYYLINMYVLSFSI